MASPIGHALVGIGLAAGIAHLTNVNLAAPAWLGLAAASCLPDLDLAAMIFGLPARRTHRGATHSLVALSVLMVGATWSWDALFYEIPGVVKLACAAVLLSHPLVDVLLTGPETAAAGFGIPLLWPLSRRRWFMPRPLLQTRDVMACRSPRELLPIVLAELSVLGPLPLAMFVLAHIR